MIDLHIHSHFSDGQESYDQIFQRASELNLAAFSIADHNYLWPSAQEYFGETRDAQFIPGIEISCVDPETQQTLHLLGYSRHFDTKTLNEALEPVVAGYNERAKRIIVMLNEKFGCKLSFDAMLGSGPAVFVSRNAIGHELLRYIDKKMTITEAVHEAFVPGETNGFMPNVNDAIDIVHQCGGVAVLAHPGNLFTKLDVPGLFRRLAVAGLSGIEVYYPKHDAETTQKILAFAEQHGFIVTAGSDWHGPEYSNYPMGADVEINISQLWRQ